MSRVGRLPIPLPKEVVVKIDNGEVSVKGPKGELHRIWVLISPSVRKTAHW